ncbi:MAG: MBL fold metallo-hydrolase [Chloroflexi bacterium]|nr:MBL fold metallo-hydrolase [Chloroflexota bacterium]
MKITFLGGADEVGASGLLVESGGRRVLVDCGIRPSPKSHWGLGADQLPDLSQIESGSGKLDAILVTHAHTDHTGALELVVERFPDVPVYATAPTLALTRVLHQDSRRIMQSRLDEEGELPLFDDLAVERLLSALTPVPFYTRLPLGEGLAATFFPAGHIAGAAMIGLESDEGRLLISGDLSISPQRTVDGARPPAFRPDAIILESTYGGRLHANRAVQERKLVETVAQVTAGGGKVLIPAFALGRAQEILLILDEYQRRGELPAVPVWADGMVRAICQAYPTFGEALPLALQERNAQFFNERIRPVQSAEQRNALIWNPGAAVIVASSGMLAGGPSLSYARALASKPEHAILLTGYQDEESPGRRLQQLSERGSPFGYFAGSIRLGADKVDVQCRIATYSLSAHADEGQLINLTETLDPEHVFLVHGDLPARQSLEKAIGARGRILHLPANGETFELQFEKRGKFVQPDQSDDPRRKWNELLHQRRGQMLEFAEAAGKWILLKSDASAPARCLAIEPDHLWVEIAPGLEQAVYPEAVLAVFGESHPTPAELQPYQPQKSIPTGAVMVGNCPTMMEPNQALAFANQHFPPAKYPQGAARLRKSGYRLEQRILTLTFDFPDAARGHYADEIAALQTATGWTVEITPEANQNALNALVREVLPPGWQIVKGPAIHRQQKRVAATVSQTLQTSEVFPFGDDVETSEVSRKFLAATGWTLDISLVSQPKTSEFSENSEVCDAKTGARMEINAAYAIIKSTLEGSTLYRASLKGDEILLSFISRQVGERYRDQIAALAEQTGWPLSINPQPNQGAILEIARALLNKSALTIAKGPSIYPEKADVAVTLAVTSAEPDIAELTAAFTAQTGFRLTVTSPTIAQPTEPCPEACPACASAAGTGEERRDRRRDAPRTTQVVEIPLNRIRLNSHQQSLSLDPAKLQKAIERARLMGITPPIQARRVRDGYILTDGLYRLRAAEALGLERIPALME